MAEIMVIYDSVFGNTAKVAEAIGEATGAQVLNVSDAAEADLKGLSVLFVGSPTRGFRPTPAIMSFLNGLGPDALSGVKGAAFDTRFPIDKTESGFLRFMIRLFGYADAKIAKGMQKAGATLALENEGFGVTGSEGPLIEGELERAQDWARQILAE